jgi:hypothetical protein
MDDDLSPLLKGLGKLPHNRADDQRTRKFYENFPDVELSVRRSRFEIERHRILSNFPELTDPFIRKSHPQAGKLRNIDRYLDLIDSVLALRQGVQLSNAQVSSPGIESGPQKAAPVLDVDSKEESCAAQSSSLLRPQPKVQGQLSKPTEESEDDRATRRQSVMTPILKTLGWTPYRWEQEAGVGSKVANRYLSGKTRRLRSEPRIKLEQAMKRELQKKGSDLTFTELPQ